MAGTTKIFSFLLVVSMLVGVSLASLCSDQCNGACEVAKAKCEATIIFGHICGISEGLCKQGCAAFCGCADGCIAECQPELDECKEKALNKLFLVQCNLENNLCLSQCQQLCAATKVGEKLSQAVASLFQN